MSKGADTNDHQPTEPEQIAWDDIDAETQHELVALAETLGSEQPEEDAKSQASRREIIKAAGALGLGAAVGGGSYRAFTQPAAASHGGGSVGTSSTPVDLFADTVESNHSAYIGGDESTASDYLGSDLTSIDGIAWALREGNSSGFGALSSSSAFSPHFIAYTSGGDDLSNPTAVSDGDLVAGFQGQGRHANGGFAEAGNLELRAVNPSGGDVPSKWVLENTDTTGTLAESFAVDENHDVSTPNGGITTNSLATDDAQTKTSPVVNVQYFGADGDGSDQTAAIDNAVSHARSIGAMLYFPTGQYNFTNQIVADWKGGGIKADGQESTELVYDGNEQRAIVPAETILTFKDFTLSAGSGSHVEGISTDTAKSYNGLQQSEFHRVRVSGFTNTGGWAFNLEDVYSLDLVRCDAFSCDAGYKIDGSGGGDITFIACNSRQHNGASAVIDGAIRAVNFYGGNYANSSEGIVIGQSGRVNSFAIHGTYHEQNTNTDIEVYDALNALITPARCASPKGIHVRKARDFGIDASGCEFANSTTAIELGDSSNDAQRGAIRGTIRQDGAGTELTITDSFDVYHRHPRYIRRLDEVSSRQTTIFTVMESAAPAVPTDKSLYFDESVPGWRYTTDGGSNWTNV